MSRKLLFLLIVLILSSCGPYLQPAGGGGAVVTPTPEISSTPISGGQPYANTANGYSLSIPNGYEVTRQTDSTVAIVGPGEDGETRGVAWITVEPANGRTTEQVVEAVKADLGKDFNLIVTTIEMDDTQAQLITGMPGQDPNRQVFMTHGDQLYHLTFSPDDPHMDKPYQQMEDLYVMTVKSFHFTK